MESKGGERDNFELKERDNFFLKKNMKKNVQCWTRNLDLFVYSVARSPLHQWAF